MKSLKIGKLYRMISGSRHFLPVVSNGNGWSLSSGASYPIEAGETFLIVSGEAMLQSAYWMIALYGDKFVFVPMRPGPGENVYEELASEEE